MSVFLGYTQCSCARYLSCSARFHYNDDCDSADQGLCDKGPDFALVKLESMVTISE